jgi:hypothetical protein
LNQAELQIGLLLSVHWNDFTPTYVNTPIQQLVHTLIVPSEHYSLIYSEENK